MRRRAALLPDPAPPDLIGDYVSRWAPLIGRLASERKERDRAEWEHLEAAELAPEPRSFEPGDLVRFTADALRSMYGVNQLGFANWAPDRLFTVAPCACGLCELGQHVAVHEGRHVARAALEHAPRPPAGPVRREDAQAVLEQLGMRVDDAGNYYVRPPC